MEHEDIIVIDWVPEYEGLYLASNTGQVYGCKHKKILKPMMNGNGYERMGLSKHGVTTGVSVHRIIAMTFIPNDNPVTRCIVDHINRVRNDNRASNLRWASHEENSHNITKRTGCASQFLGVYWDNKRQKWQAQIIINKSKKHLGYFSLEHDAALAYDLAAFEKYGERANLNLKS